MLGTEDRRHGNGLSASSRHLAGTLHSGVHLMLNTKEKVANLVPLIFWAAMTLAVSGSWLSENLGSASLLRTALNYLMFTLVFAFSWWGISTYSKRKPREFWNSVFAYGAPLYILAGVVAWSGWVSGSIFIVPLITLVFFVVNERWGTYLDSLSSPAHTETSS
ncbi:hypothetical protein ACFYV7_35555 [Nocardia suismassiliense]|uniref:EamA domain-containing protein n=1 Tax=Nocardia suismassiliense TaxID=2077092 RepID=A0ABW6R500_9NOCA